MNTFKFLVTIESDEPWIEADIWEAIQLNSDVWLTLGVQRVEDTTVGHLLDRLAEAEHDREDLEKMVVFISGEYAKLKYAEAFEKLAET